MRLLPRLLLAGALGLAGAFLVACGDRNNLLPADTAGALKRALSSVENAVNEHKCGAAQAAAQNFNDEVLALGGKVDKTLRRNLRQGAQTVAKLAPESCQKTVAKTTSTPTVTTQTETTTTETDTTPTETTPTETTPTETTPTETTPTETETGGTGTSTDNNGGGGAPGPGDGNGGASPGQGNGNG